MSASLTRVVGVVMLGGEVGAVFAACTVNVAVEGGVTLNLYSGNDWVRATRLKQAIQREVDAAQPGGIAEIDLNQLQRRL